VLLHLALAVCPGCRHLIVGHYTFYSILHTVTTTSSRHVYGIKRCKRYVNRTDRVAEAVVRVVGLADMMICGRASNITIHQQRTGNAIIANANARQPLSRAPNGRAATPPGLQWD
jgi:hypothetical protein